jgi:dipeptidyl-peptidase-4
MVGWTQQKIEIQNLLDGTFSPRSVRSVNWMQDGQFYSALRQNQIVKFDITTGDQVEVLVNGDELDLKIDDYRFSADESQVLLLTDRQSIYRRSFTADYYLYSLGASTAEKLSEDRQSYATFSPDGKKVAFTRDNNLFYKNLETDEEIAVTDDGRFNYIINGSSDWVYEEELYITKAFEWSPDSKKLAYYRFDESEVPEYNMQVWNDGALYPEDYRYKYPKAGETNSTIEIFVYELSEDKKTKVDIGEETDIYIPRIYWTKDANLLAVQRLNRLQNKLDILHVDAFSGSSEVILTDESETYIDFTFCDDLTYLDNGKQFLFSSEKDGYKHFYLYSLSGKLEQQITSGEFEATQLVGLDQDKGMLYYLSTETSPLEQQLYAIRLNGKGKKKLSDRAGVDRINMSGDTRYYLKYHSSDAEPLRVSLHQTEGNTEIKVLQDNEDLKARIKEFNLVDKEYFTYESEDGTELPGYMLKPADFSEQKQFPVLMYQYSGPGSQSVSNGWGGSHFAFHQLLTQKGYIVAVVDTRGTGNRGDYFKKQTYKQLGTLEVQDLISAGEFLGDLSYIDKARVGIWGWSYGGYMSSLAILKGAETFKAAIAVAPVTTWRYYDTIYTERYLQRPQDNPGGYDQNSPIQFTDLLKGNYLLVHGTGDDNVHFQNAVALQEELINSGKQFETFYYPDKAHGIGGVRGHLYQMLVDFLEEKL